MKQSTGGLIDRATEYATHFRKSVRADLLVGEIREAVVTGVIVATRTEGGAGMRLQTTHNKTTTIFSRQSKMQKVF